MSKAYFPLFVDISNHKIIVVGGGTIATRRVKTLVQFAEHITVIAIEISDELRNLETLARIKCIEKTYEDSDIRDSDIVLAATNNKALNHHIAETCKALEVKENRKILLSVADDRSLCDFYFPAVIQSDDITVGINSGGADPQKVKEIRAQVEGVLKR